MSQSQGKLSSVIEPITEQIILYNRANHETNCLLQLRQSLSKLSSVIEPITNQTISAIEQITEQIIFCN